MAGRLQLRRGTTSQNDVFTGAVGEMTMDTQKKNIRLHDGATQGGCGFIDPVVAFQIPTAENNYTWYRKYASGWVEQGGENAVAGTSVSLPVTMANTVYYAACLSKNATDTVAVEMHLKTRTTTTVLFTSSFNGSDNYTGEVCVWEVKGMAA